jgi:hypothetical protein
VQPSSTSPPTKAAKAGASGSSDQDFRCSPYPQGPAASAAAAAPHLAQNLAGVFLQQQQQQLAAAAPPVVPAAAAAAAPHLAQNLAGVFLQQQQQQPAAAAPPVVPAAAAAAAPVRRRWWQSQEWQLREHPEVSRRAAERAAASSRDKVEASAQRYSRNHQKAVQKRQRLGLPAPQTGVGPADTRGAKAGFELHRRRFWGWMGGVFLELKCAGGARQMCFPAQVRTQRSSAAAPR